MKIKWKFEEDREDIDEYGNLKSYYNDSEPWKKPDAKPNYYLQTLKIMLVLVLCGVLVVVGMALQDYYGYDWNRIPGIQIIRNILDQRIRI